MRYQEDDQLRQPQSREGGLEIEYHLSDNETASPKSSREFWLTFLFPHSHMKLAHLLNYYLVFKHYFFSVLNATGSRDTESVV